MIKAYSLQASRHPLVILKGGGVRTWTQLGYLEKVCNTQLSADATKCHDRHFFGATAPADSWRQEVMRRAVNDESYFTAGVNAMPGYRTYLDSMIVKQAQFHGVRLTGMTPNFQGEFGVNASGTSALLVRLDYCVGAHNWRHSANPDTVRGIVDYFNDDMDVEAAFPFLTKL